MTDKPSFGRLDLPMPTTPYRWLTDRPLSQQLTILMSAVAATALILAVLLLVNNELANLRQAEADNRDSKQTLAQMIAAGVKSPLLFDDREVSTDILQSLQQDPAIDYGAVYKPDGELFAEFRRDADEAGDVPSFELLPGARNVDGMLQVVSAVEAHPQNLGFVALRSSLQEFEERRQRFAKVMVWSLCLSFLLAFLLAKRWQRVITGPILSMVEHMEGVYKGRDYSARLPTSDGNEFGSLHQGFNHLLDKVQEREQELRDHGDYLQALVDERTKQLRQQAQHDALTGLPNRHAAIERMQRALSQPDSQFALVFIDLDRFKAVNDSFGHSVGDALLKAVSERLQGVLQSPDWLARVGGDEFLALCFVNATQALHGKLDQISAQFDALFDVLGIQVQAGASIGVSRFPENGSTASELLRHADEGMYQAKQSGDGAARIFDASMQEVLERRLQIEQQLQQAIVRGELSVVYQPKLNAKIGEIDGAEALLRWTNEKLGFVSPAEFIPIAEECGLIMGLGAWVMQQVFAQLGRWRQAGQRPLKVAINLSASHLRDQSVPAAVAKLLKTNQIDASAVEFEMTEEVFVQDADAVIGNLRALRAQGISIAIDDFGTGYSSLAYLQSLPLDVLKIDRCFVSDMEQRDDNKTIVQAALMMAHGMQLKVVAEGVENAEQQAMLMQMRCDYLQGYHIAKPLNVEDFESLLAGEG